MNPAAPCSGCGCCNPNGATTHVVVAALHAGDLDQAIAAGVLNCDGCAGCSDVCNGALLAARDARLAALAARERYRARTARLQRRAAELATKRAPAAPSIDAPMTIMARPPLPPAAAAALARAQAKAAERRKP